jgi:hypothetical protein
MAKALAMTEGLSLANRMRCNSITARLDFIEVIQKCEREEAWWDESVTIYADCVDVRSNIGSVIFKHCLREANQIAHDLSTFIFANKKSCIWTDETPSFLVSMLIDNVRCVGN